MANGTGFTPQEIEQFLRQFFDVVGARQYVGARYVPIFGRRDEETCGWDSSAPYEPLTIVTHQGDSYTSRQYVPDGIDIHDTRYWVETGRWNAQIEQYRQEVLRFQDQIDDKVPYPTDPNPRFGTIGQVLSTLANGDTQWQDPVIPSDEQAEEIITQWLDDHPEATTTVQDGSITRQKLATGYADSIVYMPERDYLYDMALVARTADNLLSTGIAVKRDGVYLQYTNGACKANAAWASYVIPVSGGSRISTNATNSQVTFYSLYVDIATLSADEIPGGFISGVVNAGQTGYVDVPAGARYMVASGPATDMSTGYMMSVGNETKSDRTPYVPEVRALGDQVTPRLDLMTLELSKKLDADTSPNFANTETPNTLDGCFVMHSSGNVNANATFTSYGYELRAGESVLSVSAYSDNYHLTFYDRMTDIATLDIGDHVPGYISGFANEDGNGHAIPSGARMVIVSLPTANTGTLQLQYAQSISGFTPYYDGLDADRVLGLDELIVTHTLYVGQNERYTTIAAAFADAADGDTIYVMPGTYDEALDFRTKNVTLRGFSRDSVILAHSGADYNEPPLEIVEGLVRDLTVMTTGQNPHSGQTVAAYCVHTDFYQETGKRLQFVNVRFYNDCTGAGRPCIGMGLRSNFTASFVNCTFESAVGEVIYCHEEQASNKSGQRVEFIDCSVKGNGSSNNNPVILLQETPALENNVATILFQRCIVASSATQAVIGASQYGTKPGLIYDGYLGTKTWVLDMMSALNNAQILDA